MNKNVYDVNLCGIHPIARWLVKDYITNLGGLKMSRLGRNFYKLHVQQEVNSLHIWVKTRMLRKKSGSQRGNFRNQTKKAENTRECESSSQSSQ